RRTGRPPGCSGLLTRPAPAPASPRAGILAAPGDAPRTRQRLSRHLASRRSLSGPRDQPSTAAQLTRLPAASDAPPIQVPLSLGLMALVRRQPSERCCP